MKKQYQDAKLELAEVLQNKVNHQRDLLTQYEELLSKFIGGDDDDVKIVGGDKKKGGGGEETPQIEPEVVALINERSKIGAAICNSDTDPKGKAFREQIARVESILAARRAPVQKAYQIADYCRYSQITLEWYNDLLSRDQKMLVLRAELARSVRTQIQLAKPHDELPVKDKSALVMGDYFGPPFLTTPDGKKSKRPIPVLEVANNSHRNFEKKIQKGIICPPLDAVLFLV